MKPFVWNEEKNDKLKLERKLGFEDVEIAIIDGNLLDIIKHPNAAEYSHQQIFIVEIIGYVHMVPFIENDNDIFLITIIPSRKMTKKYRGEKNEH